MRIEDWRMEALLWSIFQRNDEAVDRLLDAGGKFPEVTGDFYVTIDGVPACIADLSLTGKFSELRCQHSSLRRCIQYRNRFKAIYQGAFVTVVGGCCPTALGFQKTAA